MNTILLAMFFTTATFIQDKSTTPILTSHYISECLTNSKIKCRVISSNLSNNELTIKLGIKLNCIVNNNSKIDFEYYNDTLNIIIQEFITDTIISQDSTSTWTSITSTECDCFFNLDLKFENLKSYPKTYLINGLTLDQNDKLKGPYKKNKKINLILKH